jgi:hypothetical protein
VKHSEVTESKPKINSAIPGPLGKALAGSPYNTQKELPIEV